LWRLIEAGRIAWRADYVDQAIALYGEVIEIDASNTEARRSRGELLEEKKKDLKAALSDYKVAAENGNGWTLNRIGWWYMTGNGVPKDFDAAKGYFEKAAATGNETAKANLKDLAIMQNNAKK
jgi:TPR repeat protein